uniref:Uncharacterized protein n=1 Tax=Plectus sambesii TaxID=2011161 RepID=A0A914URR6_9BILA
MLFSNERFVVAKAVDGSPSHGHLQPGDYASTLEDATFRSLMRELVHRTLEITVLNQLVRHRRFSECTQLAADDAVHRKWTDEERINATLHALGEMAPKVKAFRKTTHDLERRQNRNRGDAEQSSKSGQRAEARRAGKSLACASTITPILGGRSIMTTNAADGLITYRSYRSLHFAFESRYSHIRNNDASTSNIL